mmetsp:Transcript_5204/g.14697  ORF Transcript_5204/g.14697 Transcript_5204/m.14697 type:complete len:792 (-) Transcript_5204:265-2640(-)
MSTNQSHLNHGGVPAASSQQPASSRLLAGEVDMVPKLGSRPLNIHARSNPCDLTLTGQQGTRGMETQDRMCEDSMFRRHPSPGAVCGLAVTHEASNNSSPIISSPAMFSDIRPSKVAVTVRNKDYLVVPHDRSNTDVLSRSGTSVLNCGSAISVLPEQALGLSCKVGSVQSPGGHTSATPSQGALRGTAGRNTSVTTSVPRQQPLSSHAGFPLLRVRSASPTTAFQTSSRSASPFPSHVSSSESRHPGSHSGVPFLVRAASLEPQQGTLSTTGGSARVAADGTSATVMVPAPPQYFSPRGGQIDADCSMWLAPEVPATGKRLTLPTASATRVSRYACPIAKVDSPSFQPLGQSEPAGGSSDDCMSGILMAHVQPEPPLPPSANQCQAVRPATTMNVTGACEVISTGMRDVAALACAQELPPSSLLLSVNRAGGGDGRPAPAKETPDLSRVAELLQDMLDLSGVEDSVAVGDAHQMCRVPEVAQEAEHVCDTVDARSDDIGSLHDARDTQMASRSLVFDCASDLTHKPSCQDTLSASGQFVHSSEKPIHQSVEGRNERHSSDTERGFGEHRGALALTAESCNNVRVHLRASGDTPPVDMVSCKLQEVLGSIDPLPRGEMPAPWTNDSPDTSTDTVTGEDGFHSLEARYLELDFLPPASFLTPVLDPRPVSLPVTIKAESNTISYVVAFEHSDDMGFSLSSTCVITDIASDGYAQKTGVIFVGDRLVACNGVTVTRAMTVKEMIKARDPRGVTLRFERRRPARNVGAAKANLDPISEWLLHLLRASGCIHQES